MLLGWTRNDSDLVSLAKRLRRQRGPVRLMFSSPQRATLPPEGDPLSVAAWVQVAPHDAALLEVRPEDLSDDLVGNQGSFPNQVLVQLSSSE